jgi:RES domain-containing protein
MVLYRIAKRRYALDRSGKGARGVGGRWNSPGFPVIYVAESTALSALEYLVHVRHMNLVPENLVIVTVEIPDTSILTLPLEQLPQDWMRSPYGQDARNFGDTWIEGKRSLAMRVPSVILPLGHGWNFLLNPLHADFGSVTISEDCPFAIDSRLYPQAVDLPDRDALVRVLEKGDAAPELKNKILSLFP